MIELIDLILNLHQKVNFTKSHQEKDIATRQIEIMDKKLGQVVHQLCELTDEEIIIVESGVSQLVFR